MRIALFFYQKVLYYKNKLNVSLHCHHKLKLQHTTEVKWVLSHFDQNLKTSLPTTFLRCQSQLSSRLIMTIRASVQSFPIWYCIWYLSLKKFYRGHCHNFEHCYILRTVTFFLYLRLGKLMTHGPTFNSNSPPPYTPCD